ncbi:Integral inner nuclear membrane ima1 protein [Rutstroemia sp. NJR-2017a BBW]|nr:Integral inner nuclear membrane ima1 protein [Rutstroemia sp. NJR-2017a BBW]
MASFTRRYLVCFYCNKKSNIKYDGTFSQWDCKICEATNYLDQNGNITDPPVATFEAADSAPHYAFYRGDISNLKDPDSNFCAKCLKNQHLKVASLAQFHVEVDPDHPNYKESERRLFAFQKDLERRYPQVCADCAPRAQELRDRSDKIAKSDWLRRMLDRSRENKYKKTKDFSFINFLCSLASILWYLGIIGQVLANFTAILSATSSEFLESNLVRWVPPVFVGLVKIIFGLFVSRTWVRWSLYCSVLSLWWNPMFKQLKTGFTRHIKGYGDWYFCQVFILILRGLFYSKSASGDLADPSSSLAMAVNFAILCSTIGFSIGARRCLVVDMTPLWNSTPERLRVESTPRTSDNGGNSMSDILDEIAGTSSTGKSQLSLSTSSSSHEGNLRDTLDQPRQYGRDQARSQISSPRNTYSTSRSFESINNYEGPLRHSNGSGTNFSSRNDRESVFTQQYEGARKRSTYLPPSTDLPVTEMNQAEYLQYLQTGQLPDRLIADPMDVEPMDWAPTRPQQDFTPRHRALNPALNPQYKAQPFGSLSTTFNEPSPFHGKLPPAPITPAQRLRNPPNQARLTVNSEEKKQNFFNRMTGKSSNDRFDSNIGESVQSKREMEIAPPKFFAPERPGNDQGNQLADLLTSFSLSTDEDENSSQRVRRRFRKRYFIQVIVIIAGLYLWKYTSTQSVVGVVG